VASTYENLIAGLGLGMEGNTGVTNVFENTYGVSPSRVSTSDVYNEAEYEDTGDFTKFTRSPAKTTSYGVERIPDWLISPQQPAGETNIDKSTTTNNTVNQTTNNNPPSSQGGAGGTPPQTPVSGTLGGAPQGQSTPAQAQAQTPATPSEPPRDYTPLKQRLSDIGGMGFYKGKNEDMQKIREMIEQLESGTPSSAELNYDLIQSLLERLQSKSTGGADQRGTIYNRPVIGRQQNG